MSNGSSKFDVAGCLTAEPMGEQALSTRTAVRSRYGSTDAVSVSYSINHPWSRSTDRDTNDNATNFTGKRATDFLFTSRMSSYPRIGRDGGGLSARVCRDGPTEGCYQPDTLQGAAGKASPPSAASSIYRWLYDYGDHYMACLDTFQQFSDEWRGVNEWIEAHLTELVEKQLIAKTMPQPDKCDVEQPLLSSLKKQTYAMLGVGSGSGEVDAAIFRVLLPRFHHVSATVMEPDHSQISLYRQLMADNAEEFTRVSFDIRQQTSSEFLEDNIDATFDLIHMVHVVYHMNLRDLKTTLLQYYRRLNLGGIMFLTYESEKSSLARIRAAIQPFEPGMLPYMSIRDIELELRKAVGPAYKREDFPGILDVTACFDKDPTASGECLWDFITRVVNFRASVPEKVAQKVTGMLREYSWTDDRGRILTNIDTAVIIVTKNLQNLAKIPGYGGHDIPLAKCSIS